MENPKRIPISNAESKVRSQSTPSGIKRVVAVFSAKGGVGKSTIAASLALHSVQSGLKVGLLDGDIYGPNIPRLFGIADTERLGITHVEKASEPSSAIRERPLASRPIDPRQRLRTERSTPASTSGGERRLVPHNVNGIKLVSMALVAEPATGLMWRGPMISGAFKQFVEQTLWGELDVLILDMPPGTGDIPLTMAQTVKPGSVVLVTTPQELSATDAERGATMLDKLQIPVSAIVENMALWNCPNCHSQHEIFGRGAGEKLQKKLGVKPLIKFPIVPSVAEPGALGSGTLPPEFVDSVQQLYDCLDLSTVNAAQN